MGPRYFTGVGGEMVSRSVWNDSSVDLHLESLFAYFWDIAKSKSPKEIKSRSQRSVKKY